MVSANAMKIDRVEPQVEPSWPAEVEFILSALEAGRHNATDRRQRGRRRYRVRAELQLFADGAGAEPWVLYTRDVNEQGLGFITSHRLPLGYGGRLRLTAPGGDSVVVECVLLRCREAVSGWYEGSLYFNRAQWMFEDQ